MIKILPQLKDINTILKILLQTKTRSSEAESSSNESQGNDASKENSSKVSKPTPRQVFFHSGCRAESRKTPNWGLPIYPLSPNASP